MPPETMRNPSSVSPAASAAGVAHDLGRVVGEPGLGRELERHRLRRDDVHQRAALEAGEHGLVDRRRVLGGAQDAARRGGRAASCAW